MIGIILAAGIGTRLRPMTNTKPKCLVTTAGKPILQYQIDAYILAGVAELIIVVGYEGDAVRSYCKHIKDIKITIIENPDYEITNNMFSLYLAKKKLDGRAFILNNADLSIDVTIVKMLIEHPAENAIAVDRSVYNHESMKLAVNRKGIVSDISKEIDEASSHGCSIDFYKFSAESSRIFFAEMLQIIEQEKNLKDWTEVAMQRLMRSGTINFQPCDITGTAWVEIDNYADLAQSDRVFTGFDTKLNEIDSILLDLDGTVYVGSQVVPGAVEAIHRLQEKGKRIYFLSNNSSKNKFDYVQRLASIGVETELNHIVLSTDGLIDFLLDENVESVHVLGTNSLKKSIMDQGFRIDSDKPEYVVVGYDTELSYPKLVTACKHINEGVDILATHSDRFCPSEFGPIPDVGAIISLLTTATGKVPKRIFGKPDMAMIQPLIAQNLLNPQRTLLIGDRLHTDIKMSALAKCYGLLVLTGETTRDQVEDSDIQPDFILDSIGEI